MLGYHDQVPLSPMERWRIYMDSAKECWRLAMAEHHERSKEGDGEGEA